MKRHAFRSILVVFCVLALVSFVLPANVGAEPSEHPFEIVPGSFQMSPSTDQAGAHEDLTTSFDVAHEASGKTYNDLRDTVVNLPAGLVASDTAVPTCPPGELNFVPGGGGGSNCPAASQVGTISFTITTGAGKQPFRFTFPVFNMEVTSFGVAAELGFNDLLATQVLPVSVRPGDTGLTVASPDIVGAGEPHDVSVTIWGVPASPVHDEQRGEECLEGGCVRGNRDGRTSRPSRSCRCRRRALRARLLRR